MHRFRLHCYRVWQSLGLYRRNSLDPSEEVLVRRQDPMGKNSDQLVKFIKWYMFSCFNQKSSIMWIVSNPLYIPSQVIEGLVACMIMSHGWPRRWAGRLKFYRILAEEGKIPENGGSIYSGVRSLISKDETGSCLAMDLVGFRTVRG